MQKSIDVRLVVLAVLAGFLGGVLSDIALPELALAQAEPAPQVTAQEFRVVDSQGSVLAVIGAAVLPLGKDTPIELGKGTPTEFLSEGSIQLFDSGGRIVWSAPQPLVHPAAGKGVVRNALRSPVLLPE